jgi:hypothetical protein
MSAFRKAPKPAWGGLYGIVTVMCGLLAVVEVTIPDGLARRALECVAALAIFGAMAVWVRANRVALAMREGGDVQSRVSWKIAGVIPRLSWRSPRRKRPGGTAAS